MRGDQPTVGLWIGLAYEGRFLDAEDRLETPGDAEPLQDTLGVGDGAVREDQAAARQVGERGVEPAVRLDHRDVDIVDVV